MASITTRCVRKGHNAKAYSVQTFTISCQSRNWWKVQKERTVDLKKREKALEIVVNRVQTKAGAVER